MSSAVWMPPTPPPTPPRTPPRGAGLSIGGTIAGVSRDPVTARVHARGTEQTTECVANGLSGAVGSKIPFEPGS